MVGGYLLLLVLPSLKHVSSYSFGTPSSACINNFPKHNGAEQQETASSYILTLSPNTYSANSEIKVTITAPAGRSFKGFQVRAQAVSGNTEELIGTFPKAIQPDNVRGNYWWPLAPGSVLDKEPNCVTHNNNATKTKVTLTWKAPASGVGDLVFRAVIVQDFHTFWVSDNNATLKAKDPYTPPATSPTDFTIGLTPPLSLDSECGHTKGCMLYPNGCKGNDCLYAVSYTTSSLRSAVTFEVSGVTSGYLSLAFSDDVAMGKDLTTTCVQVDNIYSLQNGYDPAYSNDQHPLADSGVSNVSIERKGDRVNCRFTRELSSFIIDVNDQGMASKLDFPLNKPWYIFLAHGKVYKGTSVVAHHAVLPLISVRKVDLLNNTIVHARSLQPSLRAHGTLGILSWIAMVGTAILIALFYKSTLGGKLLGTPVWFQVHRTLVLLAILISVSGIVIIFVYVKGWTKYAAIHGVFGLIAIGFGMLGISSGLLRPSQGTSKRTIFNWFHRTSGMLSFTCSAVCVLLAFQVSLIGAPLSMQGTVTVAAWLGFYVVWFIVLQILHFIRDNLRCAKALETLCSTTEYNSVAEYHTDGLKYGSGDSSPYTNLLHRQEENADQVENVTKNDSKDAALKPGHHIWRVVHLVWLVVGVLVTVSFTILILFFIIVA